MTHMKQCQLNVNVTDTREKPVDVDTATSSIQSAKTLYVRQNLSQIIKTIPKWLKNVLFSNMGKVFLSISNQQHWLFSSHYNVIYSGYVSLYHFICKIKLSSQFYAY